MNCTEILFSRHVLARMFERGLNEDDVRSTIRDGIEIARYPDDTPYPSYLLLGFRKVTPLHVVVGRDDKSGRCITITAYVPDPSLWLDDYRKRRR